MVADTQQDANRTVQTSAAPSGLISASELETALLESPADWVVFDCRFALAEPTAGYNDYLHSHIPGAYYLHLEHDLSSPVQPHGGRHPLPDAEVLADKLRAAGVDAERHVVVYDADGSMAPRAWWLLRYLGHPDVRVLDGGWQAWVSAGLPINAEVPSQRTGHFQPLIQSEQIAEMTEIEQIATGKAPGTLVDARAARRFRGEVEPIDARAGHIPGAVNRPWEDGVEAVGKWKSGSEQRRRFAGLEGREGPLVMYCGSGVTACANLFALELAGIHGAKLYPGSWSDWSSYPNHPVEQGDGTAGEQR